MLTVSFTHPHLFLPSMNIFWRLWLKLTSASWHAENVSLWFCPLCSNLSPRLQEWGNLHGSRNLQLSWGMAGWCLPYWWVNTNTMICTHVLYKRHLFGASSSSPAYSKSSYFVGFAFSGSQQTAECNLNPMDATEGIFSDFPDVTPITHKSFIVSQVYKSLNTSLFHLGCSCVHSPLPEWREVYFSQQVPLPPPFLRPSLRGEEKVPLAWPCWGQRLMRSNKGLYADKDHVFLAETLLILVEETLNHCSHLTVKTSRVLYCNYCH